VGTKLCAGDRHFKAFFDRVKPQIPDSGVCAVSNRCPYLAGPYGARNALRWCALWPTVYRAGLNLFQQSAEMTDGSSGVVVRRGKQQRTRMPCKSGFEYGWETQWGTC